MGRKEQTDDKKRAEEVLQILKKQAPLTVKQEKFCNDACVERFLKSKGDNVKKAAKHLRSCLSWRENIGTEHLIADEFSAELADGVAYVAGHDQEARPVMVMANFTLLSLSLFSFNKQRNPFSLHCLFAGFENKARLPEAPLPENIHSFACFYT
eukprot:TRINITY_DN120_c2_g1_i2.p3 TRINITY_DN120_c2_g1~~TRINITY_DN120_c2_g1_i2.p3  ORF type:complete len:154 (-),score=40.99 TRINITY_DN120_c2_g1_i2:899-1360(-)